MVDELGEVAVDEAGDVERDGGEGHEETAGRGDGRYWRARLEYADGLYKGRKVC